MGDLHYFILFLVQMIVVIAACKAAGWLGGRFLGQTPVVMEMVTGIVLGPSIFGMIAPRTQEMLFPKVLEDGSRHPNMILLYCVAQLGLVLYMFLVGLEFDASILSQERKGIVAISVVGIVVPFLLGAVAAFFLIANGTLKLFGPDVTPTIAALYVGASMCITAFPMLARILAETKLAQTRLGTLTLGAGATNDVAAWAILAIVLSSINSNPTQAMMALIGGPLFVVIMLMVVRPLFARWITDTNDGHFGVVIIALLACALVTDMLGLHAVFGAFVCGLAIPRGSLVKLLTTKIHSLTVTCLLPFFFCFSGLNTKFGLLDTRVAWLICGLLVAVAIVGKYGGCYLAARYAGCGRGESSLIGVLMNTRGMMELIILNVGLQANVITPTFFTMMVIMAVVTTLMTGPIFKLLKGKHSIETT
ncbi:MAG TPA: cation:proton antiporter [Fimbriimonas sp.]|nr:cation:proton antiporter [Fimbriimonas sp.]